MRFELPSLLVEQLAAVSFTSADLYVSWVKVQQLLSLISRLFLFLYLNFKLRSFSSRVTIYRLLVSVFAVFSLFYLLSSVCFMLSAVCFPKSQVNEQQVRRSLTRSVACLLVPSLLAYFFLIIFNTNLRRG